MSTTPAQQGHRDGIAAHGAGIGCWPALDPAATYFVLSHEHDEIVTYLRNWQRGWVETDLAAKIPDE